MDVNDDNDAILTKALSGLTYELKVFNHSFFAYHYCNKNMKTVN